jgi:hypothetical protein
VSKHHYGTRPVKYPSSIKGCRYPTPLGTAGFQVKMGGRMVNRNFEVVELGGQKYRREKVKDKVHFVGMDSQGKPITIPYQTCTLVKVREVANE